MRSALRVAVEYFRQEHKETAQIGYLNPGSTSTPMFNSMISAITKQQGPLNNAAKPADPLAVAKFIQAVLEKTSNEDYRTIDWDFRIGAHQKKVHAPTKLMIKAKL